MGETVKMFRVGKFRDSVNLPLLSFELLLLGGTSTSNRKRLNSSLSVSHRGMAIRLR